MKQSNEIYNIAQKQSFLSFQRVKVDGISFPLVCYEPYYMGCKMVSLKNQWLLIAFLLLFQSLDAYAEIYTGTLEPEDPSTSLTYFSTIIPITIAEDSRVSFTVSLESCSHFSYLYMEGVPSGRYSDLLNNSPETPQGLKAGVYEMEVGCSSTQNSNSTISYQVESHLEPIYATVFKEDLEPDSEEVITIAQTTAFEGWTDLRGYTELYINGENTKGADLSDVYYVNIAKGNRLNIKLEWDIRDPSEYNRCYVYFNGWEDGETKLPNIPYYRDDLAFSGDITPDYTLQREDGSYRFYVDCVPTGDNDVMGYKVTIMLNGVEEPPPPPPVEDEPLEITIKTAVWRDRDNDPVNPKELAVEYQIYNPNDITRTITPKASAYFPMANDGYMPSSYVTYDNLFYWGDRPDFISTDCTFGGEHLDDFCISTQTAVPFDQSVPDDTGEMCRYFRVIDQALSADYVEIPPHQIYTGYFQILASESVYAKFDKGVQAILLEPSSVSNANCHIYGTVLPIQFMLHSIFPILLE